MIHGRRVSTVAAIATVAAAQRAVVSGTGAGPRPVHMNEDACGYCRMEITDARFASPMGRVIAFASPVAARAATTRLGGTTVSWAAILSDSAGITGHEAH